MKITNKHHTINQAWPRITCKRKRKFPGFDGPKKAGDKLEDVVGNSSNDFHVPIDSQKPPEVVCKNRDDAAMKGAFYLPGPEIPVEKLRKIRKNRSRKSRICYILTGTVFMRTFNSGPLPVSVSYKQLNPAGS